MVRKITRKVKTYNLQEDTFLHVETVDQIEINLKPGRNFIANPLVINFHEARRVWNEITNLLLSIVKFHKASRQEISG